MKTYNKNFSKINLRQENSTVPLWLWKMSFWYTRFVSIHQN